MNPDIFDFGYGCGYSYYAPLELVIADQNARANAQLASMQADRARQKKREEERQARIEAYRKSEAEKERKIQERIEHNRRMAEREEAIKQLEEEAARGELDPGVMRFRLLDLD